MNTDKFSRWKSFLPFDNTEKRALEIESAIKRHGFGTAKFQLVLKVITEKYRKLQS